MLKKLFRGVVVLLAVVGAYAAIRFLCWPRPAIVFEDEDWVVLLMEGETGRCVVLDRNGAPIPAFPLETMSDSGVVAETTDGAGRGRYLSFDPQSATALLPTGEVRWTDMGFAVIVRKRP